MLLRVGELARRSGLTVRTLHHYDSIGLLVPSARSDSGYRLYSQRDVSRLHQIQALRRFGVSLADIAATLEQPALTLASVVAQQIRQLDRQIADSTALRERLARLHAQCLAGEEPEMADWLTTLELMTMYDKYFTQQELEQLPFYRAGQAEQREWAALVARAQALLTAGGSPEDEAAQHLATEWMGKLERDTAGNPGLMAKLNHMHDNEPAMQAQTGVTPQVVDFIMASFAETKIALYRKYLAPAEFAHLKAHYAANMRAWPPLIMAVRELMAGGVPPTAPEAGRLAGQWMALFRAYAGDDPATQDKIRTALAAEPGLTKGTWIDDRLLDYLRQAVAAQGESGQD